MKIRSHPDGTLPDHADCDNIFVFGSNATGEHFGGAARVAHELFGARWGHISGFCGHSYAIATMRLREEDPRAPKLKPQLEVFRTFVRHMPNQLFFLTRVGCGIACYPDREVIRLLGPVMPNISYPDVWVPLIQEMFP